MPRRRKGDKVDGWVILDKPSGMGSTPAVAAVRRLFNAQKAGHAGTLDPLASGILPIALGEATKTVPFIMDATKTYAFDILWGTATDSLDADGSVTASGGRTPMDDEITAVLPGFVGTVSQMPPAFSALKVDGERAYTLARAGKAVKLEARLVHIKALTLVAHDADAGISRFEVTCGKGTYVRSIARDIADKLKTYGHISMLRRCAVGPFDEESAISFEKLEGLSHSARAVEALQPLMTALDDIPALAVTDAATARLRQGQKLRLEDCVSDGAMSPMTVSEGQYRIVEAGSLVAIVRLDNGLVRPERVFNG